MSDTTQTQEQRAYRDLVGDCAGQEPIHGFTDVCDLPELTMEDLAVVCLAKNLPIHTVTAAKLALLADVQFECEIRNERRAERRDEDYYGSASPQTDRERAESYYGVGRLFR